MLTLKFNNCFSPAVLAELEPLLPATYACMDQLAPWRRGRWPTRIHCMDEREIVGGLRSRGLVNQVCIDGQLVPHAHCLSFTRKAFAQSRRTLSFNHCGNSIGASSPTRDGATAGTVCA